MAYRLEAGETLGGGLRRVVLEQAASAEETLREEKDPLRAAHESRRRGKEIRAALRLLRDGLPPETYASIAGTFRAATGRLADARDAEVALEALEGLRRHQRLLRSERAIAERVLRGRRDDARDALSAATLGEVGALINAAAVQLPAGDGGEDAAMVEDRVRRLYRRGRRRMRAAARTGAVDDYHAWRRDAKDLGYVVRLFGGAWEGPLAALAEELQQVGKALGDEHDLSVLREALLAAGGEPPVLTPRIDRAIHRRQQKLRARAHALGGRLWVEKPSPFAARLLGYWQVWHADAGASPQ